jgi:hypothetical protein
LKTTVVVATRIKVEMVLTMKEAEIRGQYLSSAEFIRDAIREKVQRIMEVQ